MKTNNFQTWKKNINKEALDPNRPLGHPSRFDPAFTTDIFNKVHNLTSNAFHTLKQQTPPLSEIKSHVGQFVDSTIVATKKLVKNDSSKQLQDNNTTDDAKETKETKDTKEV
jgi:hypothetical protein